MAIVMAIVIVIVTVIVMVIVIVIVTVIVIVVVIVGITGSLSLFPFLPLFNVFVPFFTSLLVGGATLVTERLHLIVGQRSG